MRGDTIVLEPHHRAAATEIAPDVLERLKSHAGKFTITVAGESGSGKSETATAIAEKLEEQGIGCVILQQDDYFVYPPKTNDATRRKDISWVGPQEVRLDLMDTHLGDFRDGGAASVTKPLVDYASDSIGEEDMAFGETRVAIAEGTYTSLLENVNYRVFIARDFDQTRAHREKRMRDKSELGPFIDEVLKIEHDIISKHRSRADAVIEPDYSVTLPG